MHERGAPHLIDPSKLLASAERLYGVAVRQQGLLVLVKPERLPQALQRLRQLLEGQVGIGRDEVQVEGEVFHAHALVWGGRNQVAARWAIDAQTARLAHLMWAMSSTRGCFVHVTRSGDENASRRPSGGGAQPSR